MKPRTVLAAIAAALCLSGTGGAAPGGCTNAAWLVPYAFETITVSSTALGFTTATFAPPGLQVGDMAVLTLETNDIRYRSDGLNPTAAVGHVLAAGGSATVCGESSLRRVRFIRVSADGVLQVSYYRNGN